MQHMALDLINTQWFSTDGAANRYFALPDTRAGHSLFAGTGNGNWWQLTSGPVIGSYANYQSLHYFVGRATSDLGLAAALMYVADRSTDHMSQNGATDVRSANLWSFDPNYSLFPFIPARVTLAAREVGHHFTLHGRLGGVAGWRVRRRSFPRASRWPMAQGRGWMSRWEWGCTPRCERGGE